jgi:Outer membrane efflux protein
VSYTLDVWGQNRRAVESQAALAQVQRFQVEAAYNTLTTNLVTAAVQQASLRGQIDAALKMIDTNSKMVDLVRRQLNAGYANRNDSAAQEAALAQVKATLPGLRQQLAVQSDVLAALAGGFPNQLKEASRFRHSICQPTYQSPFLPHLLNNGSMCALQKNSSTLRPPRGWHRGCQHPPEFYDQQCSRLHVIRTRKPDFSSKYLLEYRWKCDSDRL